MKKIFLTALLLHSFCAYTQKYYVIEYTVGNDGPGSSIGILTIPPKKNAFYYEQFVAPTGDKVKIHTQSTATFEIGSPEAYKAKTYQIYNRQANQLLTVAGIEKEKIICEEKMPVINWKITEEKKNIANYSCSKAIANFRGRNYIAWFTTSIPFQFGPWKFNGLPGLILEIHDETMHYTWNAATIKTVDKADEYLLNASLKRYSLKEYEKKGFDDYKKFQIPKIKQFMARLAKEKNIDPNAIHINFATTKEAIRTRELKFEWEQLH